MNWLDEALKRVVAEVNEGDKDAVLVIVCVYIVVPVTEEVHELVSVEICDTD